MEKTFSRPMVRLWGLKQQSPLPIFSWLRLRQQLSISTVQSRCYGRDISMTCFPYGTTIKFTADISDKEIIFLDTCIYKGARFEKESILDTRTHFKKGFVKGEGLRLLRTNSSEETFVENIRLFKLRLRARGYPHNLIDKTLSEVKFSERKKALKDNTRVQKQILPF